MKQGKKRWRMSDWERPRQGESVSERAGKRRRLRKKCVCVCVCVCMCVRKREWEWERERERERERVCVAATEWGRESRLKRGSARLWGPFALRSLFLLDPSRFSGPTMPPICSTGHYICLPLIKRHPLPHHHPPTLLMAYSIHMAWIWPSKQPSGETKCYVSVSADELRFSLFTLFGNRHQWCLVTNL